MLKPHAELKLQLIDRLLSNWDWDWYTRWDDGVPSPPSERERLETLLIQFGGQNNKHHHAALLEVWGKHTDRPFRVGPLRVARDVRQGEWFAKTEGAYHYNRISDSAAKFYNLSIQGRDDERNGGIEKYIFGMSENGNLTEVVRDRIVWTSGTFTRTVFGPRGWHSVQSTGYDPLCGYPEGWTPPEDK